MGVGGGCKVFLGFVGGFGNKIKSEIVIRDRTDNKNSISTIKLTNLLTTNPNQLENRSSVYPIKNPMANKHKSVVPCQHNPDYHLVI